MDKVFASPAEAVADVPDGASIAISGFDRAKLVRTCTYPLTGAACVDIVVTDLAVLRRVGGRFVLEDIAAGFSTTEIKGLTEMDNLDG
jgi:acyl CoA:acetate/3-ketoacid CoA transferase beta subunit